MSSIDKRPLIIDTDAGIDDAFAILATMKLSKEHGHQLIALTSCFGNVKVEQATLNCNWLVQQFHEYPSNVKVFQGCPSRLIDPNDRFEDQHCWKGHGLKGLGSIDPLKLDKKARRFFSPLGSLVLEKEHAAQAMVRLAEENKGKLDILVLGPLTNLALALKLSNSLVDNIGKVSVMGGCSRARGNASFCAEFNFWSDPESASLVLEAFPSEKLSIVPWEFTEEHGLSWEYYDELVQSGTKEAAFLQFSSSVFESSTRSNLTKFVLCDVYAAFSLLFPDTVESEDAHVCQVETHGGMSRGMLSVDWYNKSGLPKNATIVHSMNMEMVKKLFKRILL